VGSLALSLKCPLFAMHNARGAGAKTKPQQHFCVVPPLNESGLKCDLDWSPMYIAQTEARNEDVPVPRVEPPERKAVRGLVVWSSLFFAVLQSVCTFFAAVDGARLVLGVGSFVVSATMATVLDGFHTDWLRIPMIVFASFGSILNIVVIAQIRHLRNRPASQWRQSAPGAGKVRMERIQLLLSFVTIALIVTEEYLHFKWCHHL
jgi:hypothetical protein